MWFSWLALFVVMPWKLGFRFSRVVSFLGSSGESVRIRGVVQLGGTFSGWIV